MGPWRRAWMLACRSGDEWRRAHVNMCSDGVTCERRRVVREGKKKVQSKRCVVGAARLHKFIFCINAAGRSEAFWEN